MCGVLVPRRSARRLRGWYFLHCTYFDFSCLIKYWGTIRNGNTTSSTLWGWARRDEVFHDPWVQAVQEAVLTWTGRVYFGNAWLRHLLCRRAMTSIMDSLHQCRYKINVHKQTKSFNISFQSSISLLNIVFLFVYLKHYVRRYEAARSSYSTIHWVQASCCTGSRPRLNVESLLWELLANSPPMADDEEILLDVMDLLLCMQVQMYTNKLNLPIKTSGHGISYILLHIGFSSTFVCLNLSHSPLIFFKFRSMA